MPEEKNRRRELRAKLPIKIWFNVLRSPDQYVRSRSSVLNDLTTLDTQPALEGRDDVERFLLRLDKKLSLIITLLTDNINRKDYKFKGSVVDISENGFRLKSPVKLNTGAILEFGLILPNQPYRTLDLAGQVVWEKASHATAGQSGVRDIGVKFIDVLPEDQDLIVHWIFQKQREDIRRSRDQEEEE